METIEIPKKINNIEAALVKMFSNIPFSFPTQKESVEG
jgi:hypothetical protein